jgi:hypothetical protein
MFGEQHTRKKPPKTNFFSIYTDAMYSQWGNVLTLLAAYKDPKLGPSVDAATLEMILHRTIDFLKYSCHPSSALKKDWIILEHIGHKVGLYPKQVATTGNSSFSSSASGAIDRDVSMSGH